MPSVWSVGGTMERVNDDWERVNDDWERVNDDWERIEKLWERVEDIWELRMVMFGPALRIAVPSPTPLVHYSAPDMSPTALVHYSAPHMSWSEDEDY